jgi:hypothetical protein
MATKHEHNLKGTRPKILQLHTRSCSRAKFFQLGECGSGSRLARLWTTITALSRLVSLQFTTQPLMTRKHQYSCLGILAKVGTGSRRGLRKRECFRLVIWARSALLAYCGFYGLKRWYRATEGVINATRRQPLLDPVSDFWLRRTVR